MESIAAAKTCSSRAVIGFIAEGYRAPRNRRNWPDKNIAARTMGQKGTKKKARKRALLILDDFGELVATLLVNEWWGRRDSKPPA